MKVVGKASHNPSNGPIDRVEHYLPEYRALLGREGRFAYAWTFHPDDDALSALRQHLPTWLYLIGDPWRSSLKMRIVDFVAGQGPLFCPVEWKRYCISPEQNIDRFEDIGPIRIWLLIDRINPVSPPVDVRDRKQFVPLFPRKYHIYGRNFFGFFH